LCIEIDEIRRLMMKKFIWRHHGMKRAVSHKFYLVERDYIEKVKGKKESNIWDPGKYQVEMRQQDSKLS
jgi:hypothetical protein